MSDEERHERTLRGVEAIAKQLRRGYGISITCPDEEQAAYTLATLVALHPELPLDGLTLQTPEGHR